jgi:hypothetical protein
MKRLLLFVVILLLFSSVKKVSASEFPVTVTVNSTSKPISKFIWGADYNGYYAYADAEEFKKSFSDYDTRLKKLGVKMLRYPGGCPSDVYNWKAKDATTDTRMIDRVDWTGTKNYNFLTIEEFLSLTNTLGAEPLYTTNVHYKTEPNICGDTPAHYPNKPSAQENINTLIQDAADLVARYKGKIKYYELGNEQYLVGYTVEEYIAIAVPMARAMKAQDPTIEIGLTSFFNYSIGGLTPTPKPNDVPPNKQSNWLKMIQGIINTSCGDVSCFDFVSSHSYFDVRYLQDNMQYAPLLMYGYGFENTLKDFAPKKIALTEWNTANCWQEKMGDGFPVTLDVSWGMFYEEMLLTMAKKGVFIANYHDITGGSKCSLIRQNPADPSRPWRLAEQVFSLSSVLAGGRIFETDVSSSALIQEVNFYGIKKMPPITAYVGNSPDGKTYVFLLNHHKVQNARVSLDLSAVSARQGEITVNKLVASTGSLSSVTFTPTTETISSLDNIILPPISIVRLSIVPLPAFQSPTNLAVTCGVGGTTATFCWDNKNAPKYNLGLNASSNPAVIEFLPPPGADPYDRWTCQEPVLSVGGTRVCQTQTITPGMTYNNWYVASTSNCGNDRAYSPQQPPFVCAALAGTVTPTLTITPTPITKPAGRADGDADGDKDVDMSDYYYYVSAANGGKIPAWVNPDFNGDGEVGLADRIIVVRTLKL